MTRTRSAILMIYAALTPALVRANRKSSERRILATLILFRVAIEESFAKCGNVDYSWGADALASAHDYAVTMMLYVVYLCYAIAGIVVIVSALQIFIKMNTGEDGITKHILTLVGSCMFIIGASIVFPAFFGYRI